MFNKYKYYILTMVVSLCLGAGLSYFVSPPKIETKYEEITKEVEVIKKDIVYITKKTTNVDGTIVEETRTEDKSQITNETDKYVKQETKTENLKQWKLGTTYSFETNNIDSATLEKRFLGPIFVGGQYDINNKQFKISLSTEF